MPANQPTTATLLASIFPTLRELTGDLTTWPIITVATEAEMERYRTLIHIIKCIMNTTVYLAYSDSRITDMTTKAFEAFSDTLDDPGIMRVADLSHQAVDSKADRIILSNCIKNLVAYIKFLERVKDILELKPYTWSAVLTEADAMALQEFAKPVSQNKAEATARAAYAFETALLNLRLAVLAH